MMKVEEISKIEKNGKIFYKLKIDNKAFTAFDSSDAFKQLDEGKIKVGFDTKVNFTETPGTYQGKPITYRNINFFEDIKEGVPMVDNGSKSNMSKEEWLEKDVRIVRMSCLTRAIEYFELNKERMGEVVGVIPSQTIVNQAKFFEEYVMAKDVKKLGDLE